MFLSKLILSGTHYTRDTLPVDYPGGWQAYIQLETDAMKLPYLILAILFDCHSCCLHLFKIAEDWGTKEKRLSSDKTTSSGKTQEGSQKEKLIDFGVLKHSHLRWGVIAQFFYNGRTDGDKQSVLGLLLHLCRIAEDTATTFFGLYMLAFLLGRWIGTGLMVKFRPQDMLLVYALMNILLCGVVMIWGGMIGLYAMLGYLFLYVYNVPHGSSHWR